MKVAVRAVVALMAMVATLLFVFWVPFALLLPPESPEWIPFLGSLACALVVGRFVWTRSDNVSNGLINHMLLGGIVTGAVGFTAGFFGPLIFTPDANQGPLLGIFITGPIGLLLGAMAGAGYWLVHARHALPD